VLLVLLAAEGVTILQVRNLITVHFFIGMLLLCPVALKAGSVIYRFVRYYTGSAPYRRKGPPAPLLRLLGPFILFTTVGVFGTGIALAFVGPGKGPWLFLHKGFFVVWFCAMTVHVLWYLSRIPRLLSAEFRGTAIPEGRAADQGRPVSTAVRMAMAALVASVVRASTAVRAGMEIRPSTAVRATATPAATQTARPLSSAAGACACPCWSPRCWAAW
jgi:hypothetical protein